MQEFINRLVRAAKMDETLYEEVEHNPDYLKESIAVVVISSIAAGIGLGQGNFIGLTVVGLIGWFIWAYLTYFIGTKLLPESTTKADYGQLLRTIGFSSAPGIIRILGVIPVLRNLVMLVAGIWMLMAMVVAVRQALDYQSTGRAIIVCLIGWVVQFVFTLLVFGMFMGSQGV